MTRTINLDDLNDPPITATIRGQKYLIPADCPAPLWLAVQRVNQSDVASVEALAEQMLALFQVHQPDLSELPLGLVQMVRAFAAIYGEPAPEKPKPKARAQRKRAG